MGSAEIDEEGTAGESKAHSEPPPPAAVFKKRPKKGGKGKFRSRKTKDDEPEEEDDEDGEANALQDLADFREEQKQRRRRKGVDAAETLKSKGGIKKPAAEGAEGNEDDEAGLQAGPGKQLHAMIDQQFKAGGAMAGAGAIKHQNLMDAYIQKRLREKMEQQGDGDAADTAPVQLTEEDRLYVIPEEYKKTIAEARQKYGSTIEDNEQEGTGSGGQIAWATGIAEVELPKSVSRKNAEETMRLREELEKKKQLKKEQGAKQDLLESEVIGSLGANYSKHLRDRVSSFRAREKAEETQAMKQEGVVAGPAAPGKEDTAHQKQKQKSHDDVVVERFMKRSRHR